MTGPNDPYRPPNDPFSKTPPGSGESSGAFGGPPGGYGSPAYGEPSYGGSGYGGSGFGGPGYGGSGYGSPAPTPGGAPVGPSGEWLGPPLASWGIRVGGYVIDAVLIFLAATVVALVSEGLGTLVNIGLVIYFGYLTGTTGQTPGRSAVGIKVVRLSDGQVLGPGAGIGRTFLHILDSLPLLLGFLWPIWDQKKQTFADKIIGSVVLKL